MRILVKYPSRDRADQFLRVLKKYVEMADDMDNILWLFSFDDDDTSMYEMGKSIAALGVTGEIRFGPRKTKVDAINRDINSLPDPWDILLVVSDDMEPIVKGWDTHIREAMKQYRPDLDGSLWFPDGKQKDICTLPCVGRKYYERTMEVYDHRFISVFCDNLHTYQAKALGKLTFVDTVIVQHRHWANFSDVKRDPLYLENETQKIWDTDKALYESIMDVLAPNWRKFDDV